MLTGALLLPLAFCGAVTTNDLPPSQQVTGQISDPPLPLQPYPYQEDLTASIKFLKEGSSSNKSKVSSLIKLLKKVLTKYVEELKRNEEMNESQCYANKMGIEKGLDTDKIGEKNQILGITEITLVEELKNDYEIVKEVQSEKIIEEVYEVVNETDKLNPPNDKSLYAPEDKKESTYKVAREFVEDDLLNYMRNFRSKSNCCKSQQDNNVLERPVVKTEEFIKPNGYKRNTKSKRRSKNKRKPFYIPCVKASDILEEQPKYEPKEIYLSEYLPANVNSKTEEVKSTLESPVQKVITSSDSDDTVALLFKPKSISLMQAYGNLLKKITVTVLVPFHVTKLAL